MPITTDVITTYRECPETGAEAVSLAALRDITRALDAVDARVHQAHMMGQAPTAGTVRAAGEAWASASNLLRDVARHHQGVVCGWSGDVDLVRDAGAEYRWTCPRCGTEHDETVERGQA